MSVSTIDSLRAENVQACNTAMISLPDYLPVRRGCTIKLRVDDDLSSSAPSLSVVLTPTFVKPSRDQRPRGNPITIKPGAASGSGTSYAASVSGSTLSLSIPVTASVGAYAVQITGGLKPYGNLKLIVLFNPFNPKDDVFMDDPAARQEYVLSQDGRIWVGSADSFSGRPWAFGQFVKESMLCSVHLIDRLPFADAANPVVVARHLSAIINSSDDKGVITGNWSGDYQGGQSPTFWTGSAEILQQYWKTGEPVKFGQCWVFSGVFTAVLRALGIPARSVTNFESAHDADKPYNRAVDKFYATDGTLDDEKSSDSIWNFHVWNDAWMRRPDLRALAQANGVPTFDGWQAVDATPQEESHGLYQMGPAPLTAIKNGIAVDFDTDFVIGEVNANICHWWKDPNSNKHSLKTVENHSVGKNMSTKAVGRDERADVTGEYKYPEGSKEERASLARRPATVSSAGPVPAKPTSPPASAPAPNAPPVITPPATPSLAPTPGAPGTVVFTTTAPNEVVVGTPVKVVLKAVNRGRSGSPPLKVQLHVLIRATDYTGRAVAVVKRVNKETTLDPGEEAQPVSVTVQPERYASMLSTGTQQTLKVSFSAAVFAAGSATAGQVFAKDHVVRFDTDPMFDWTDVPERMPLGKPATVRAAVTNPFEKPITGAVVKVAGVGLTRPQVLRLETLQPGGRAELAFQLHPSKVGDRLLVVTVDSKELKDLARSVHIKVVN